MKRIVTGLVLAGLMIASVHPFLAEEDVAARADALYAKRYDRANVLAAVTLLGQELETRTADYELLWRLARLEWFLGDRAEGKERLRRFEQGKTYAERAVKAKEDGIEGHYWLASLIGCVGQEKGILNSLFMVGPMKRELDRCLEIDPKFGDAHDVLAQLLWKVPGRPLSIGDKKKAQEEARLATLYAPEAVEHWLHYGQIAAANKDYRTARAALQKALALPDDPEDPQGSRRDKAAAQKELEKMEGK